MGDEGKLGQVFTTTFQVLISLALLFSLRNWWDGASTSAVGKYAHYYVSIDPIMTVWFLPSISRRAWWPIQGLIGGLVQSFYAWRIYALTKNLLVVSAILLFSLVGLLGCIGTTIAVRIVPEFVYFRKFKVIAITWLSGAVCADVIITTALVLHLVSAMLICPLLGC